MKKSGDEVLNDLYLIIMDSGLIEFVDGELYKDETMRPSDSIKEDVVMTFITGSDGQIQDGTIAVNIYVLDIDNGAGGTEKNTNRTTAISRKACEIFDKKTADEYLFSLGNMVQTFRNKDINQHFVNIDLRFKRTTL